MSTKIRNADGYLLRKDGQIDKRSIRSKENISKARQSKREIKQMMDDWLNDIEVIDFDINSYANDQDIKIKHLMESGKTMAEIAGELEDDRIRFQTVIKGKIKEKLRERRGT